MEEEARLAGPTAPKLNAVTSWPLSMEELDVLLVLREDEDTVVVRLAWEPVIDEARFISWNTLDAL